MKTLKLLGIIALSTLIIIWSVSCGDPTGEDDLGELTGTVTITPSINGSVSGATITSYLKEPLKANYSGSEIGNTTYKWYISTPSGYEVITTATGETYTPQTGTGDYVVDVIIEGYEPKRSQNPAKVLDRPDYFDCFGTWKMTGTENGPWKPGGSATAIDETFVISHYSYKLTNTANEYLTYSITSWTSVNIPSQPASRLTDYSFGYRLVVSNKDTEGYADFADKAQYIFLKEITPDSETYTLARAYSEIAVNSQIYAFEGTGNSKARVYVYDKQP